VKYLQVSKYRAKHGDPDITRYRHTCQLCGVRLVLNGGVARRHFLHKHRLDLTVYMDQFRDSLLREKAARPVMPSPHTLGQFKCDNKKQNYRYKHNASNGYTDSS
jgi:hypothetical protein